MALSILKSALLGGAADPSWAATISAPVPLVWYNFDLAWGPASTDAPAAFETALTCAGATLDSAYSFAYRAHGVGATGRTGIDQGWHPDAKLVYLSGTECALGLWRIQFPSVGAYTISLANLGTVAVTVAASTGLNLPSMTLLNRDILNRQPSSLWQISWNGTYPAGGFDLPESQLGIGGILFADILPLPPLQFSWNAGKLHIYNASGEISGAVSFTTTGLFIGAYG